MEKYDIEKAKIRVIYPAAEKQFQPAGDAFELTDTKRKYNAQDGYILHFSSCDPRDNTATVLAAYKKALERINFSKKLVIGGNIRPVRAYLTKLIDELSLNDRIIFAGYLTGKELVKLYQAADLFVDATLYEGFGFHVLEAMSCGIPVVTTDVGSLPEIAQDAAILLEPEDPEKIASAIINVFQNTGLRESMSRKSLERAKRFSWDRTAKETLEEYIKLCR